MKRSAKDIVELLRKECGRSGTSEALAIIRDCNVLSLEQEGRLPHPIPNAGPDFFAEVIEALISEADK